MKRRSLRWRLLWTIGLVVTLAMVSVGVFLRTSVRQIQRTEVELELRTPGGQVEVVQQFEEDFELTPSSEDPGGVDPEQVFFARLDRRILWSLAAALVLSLAAAWLLGRHILGPVEALTEGARRIQRGDLSQRIEIVETNDEVGELASAFNAMATSLERNDDLRRNLVNDVAHELRTPLTRLQAQLEALIDGLAPASEERLRSLHADTLLLGRLVHDLEELARAEAGRLRLDIEDVDVAALLRAAGDAFEGLRGAGLRLDLQAELPPARCDAQRVRQMVDNLLTNARTHTPTGGSITLESRAHDEHVEVAVRDTGPGLAPDELERVFERFVRVDPSRQRATGGAGLGLAIVAQLAEAQGGRAWVESELGTGARFAFTLPRA